MSHFTCLVVGENPEKQLKPFQQNSWGDCDKKYLEFIKDNDFEEGGYWENTNARWDWYKLGGRWKGFFHLKKGKNVDQAKKGDIDFKTNEEVFAIVKDGKWHQKKKSGIKIYKFIENLSDDTLLSLFDCHI